MEKILLERWVYSSFHKSSDQRGKSFELHIMQTKTTMMNGSEENHFLWLLKLILKEPAFHFAGHTGDV